MQKSINLDELELSSSDLESIAIIYDKIRQIFKQYIIYKYLKDEGQKDEYDQDILHNAAGIAQEED